MTIVRKHENMKTIHGKKNKSRNSLKNSGDCRKKSFRVRADTKTVAKTAPDTSSSSVPFRYLGVSSCGSPFAALLLPQHVFDHGTLIDAQEELKMNSSLFIPMR